MKKILFMICVLMSMSFADVCDDIDPYFYTLTLKIKQTTVTLDIWEHVKNEMNEVRFTIPTVKSFWDQQSNGSKLSNSWKAGSFIFNGDFSKLSVTVVGKDRILRPECQHLTNKPMTKHVEPKELPKELSQWRVCAQTVPRGQCIQRCMVGHRHKFGDEYQRALDNCDIDCKRIQTDKCGMSPVS